MQKNGTIAKPGGDRQSAKALSKEPTMLKPQHLEDIGITPDQSSQWQKQPIVPPLIFYRVSATAVDLAGVSKVGVLSTSGAKF